MISVEEAREISRRLTDHERGVIRTIVQILDRNIEANFVDGEILEFKFDLARFNINKDSLMRCIKKVENICTEYGWEIHYELSAQYGGSGEYCDIRLCDLEIGMDHRTA